MNTELAPAGVRLTDLHYKLSGNGPSVVLIHGFSLDLRMWDQQAEALSERYQVIRYDMRGFGKSPVPHGSAYSAQDDLKALLDSLGVQAAALVGLSLGGSVAVDFALTYPQLVRKLVLVDSVLGGWEWSDDWSNDAGPVWTTGRESGVAAAREKWLATRLFMPAQEQPDVACRLQEMVGDYSGFHWTHRDPQVYLDPPAATRLEEITAPTLVVVGQREVPDMRAIAETLAARIQGAKPVEIAGAGHMANMEAPEEFNDILLEFLRED